MTTPEQTPEPNRWTPPGESHLEAEHKFEGGPAGDRGEQREIPAQPTWTYPAYSAPTPPPPPQTTNGLAIASLVTGITGVVLGLIPFLFWLGLILGLVALALGLAGHAQARKAPGSGKGMALTGTILGGLGSAMAIAWLVLAVVVVGKAADDVRAGRIGPTASPVASESTKKPDTKVLKFGQTWQSEDGIKITVTRPVPYKPGPYATGHKKGDLIVKLKVTIKNGSKAPLDLVGSVPSVRGADGTSASNVFDGNDATKPISGARLLPGKKAIGRYAYALSPTAAKELQVEVAPDTDYKGGIWLGPAK